MSVVLKPFYPSAPNLHKEQGTLLLGWSPLAEILKKRLLLLTWYGLLYYFLMHFGELLSKRLKSSHDLLIFPVYGHECEQTLGVGDGQGSLAVLQSMGSKSWTCPSD